MSSLFPLSASADHVFTAAAPGIIHYGPLANLRPHLSMCLCTRECQRRHGLRACPEHRSRHCAARVARAPDRSRGRACWNTRSGGTIGARSECRALCTPRALCTLPLPSSMPPPAVLMLPRPCAHRPPLFACHPRRLHAARAIYTPPATSTCCPCPLNASPTLYMTLSPFVGRSRLASPAHILLQVERAQGHRLVLDTWCRRRPESPRTLP